MTKPVGLQLSRARGFNLQRLSQETNGLPAIKVDRTTRWGNPWRIGATIDMLCAKKWGWTISPAGRSHVCRSQTEAMKRFRHALLWDAAIHDHIRRELGGNNLACWCGLDEPCHRGSILWLANSTPEQVDAYHQVIDEQILGIAHT